MALSTSSLTSLASGSPSAARAAVDCRDRRRPAANDNPTMGLFTCILLALALVCGHLTILSLILRACGRINDCFHKESIGPYGISWGSNGLHGVSWGRLTGIE